MKLTLNKFLSLLLVVTMLCAMLPLSAVATVNDPAELMSFRGVSRAEVHTHSSGAEIVALAFRFRLTASGIGGGAGSNYDDAKVEFGGEEYQLTTAGAVFTNKGEIGNNPSQLTIANADGKTITKIQANHMVETTDTYAEFIARINNIPKAKADTIIYARPYFVYKNKSNKSVTKYGEVVSANASGKKIRYSIETGSLGWTSGSLKESVGTEIADKKSIRTDYINVTDLLIRLPEAADGTPTMNARAYYYGTDGCIATRDITANWTVLNDYKIPSDAVSVRLVAWNEDGTDITDPAAVGESLIVTANKKQDMMPLAFSAGTLSASTGKEANSAEYIRTNYIAVRDLLVRPGDGTEFDAYFYDSEKKFIGRVGADMKLAKKLLDLVPEEAMYVRFLLKKTDETDFYAGAVDFFACLSGTEMYNDFVEEAEVEEITTTTTTKKTTTTTKKTTTTTKKTTTTTKAGTTTKKTTTKAGATTKTTTTTKKTTTTTKKTTTTTKKTTTTTKKTTTTTKASSQGLKADVPKNQGVKNALLRMQQLVKLTYTPIRVVPQSYKDIPANVTKKGVPYSSSRIEQAYVPNNVSFHTFMTALKNPNSYLYTVDLGEDYGNINGDTYYGTVCSTTCGYALGIVGDYTTYQWTQIPGMTLLKEQNVQSLELGDTIVGQGHVAMITGITRDKNGKIVEVEVSESGGIRAKASTSTITALEERFPASKYEYCRYSNISKVTYTASDYVAVGDESAATVTYNTAIIPRKGDKANWRTSETVVLDVLNKSTYTKVEIYKYTSGKWTKHATKDIASVIKLSGLAAGQYRARLTNGTKNSGWCYWLSVKAESKGAHYQGTRKVKVSFENSSNAKPLFVQWMNGATNATVRITQLTAQQIKDGYGIFTPATGKLKVRVAFQTDYGIIYSELPEIIEVK